MSAFSEQINPVLSALLCSQRHAWEQGIAMEAIRAIGRDDLLYLMAKDAVLRQQPDGRAGIVGGETAATDPCSIGGPLLYIAKKKQDPDLLAGAQSLLQWAREKAPRSRDGLVYHFLDSQEIWADSIYMLPPFLAEAGFPEEAAAMVEGYFSCLQDESGLLAHRYDDATRTFINPNHWGVGNGWALCAIARIIPLLTAGACQTRMICLLRRLTDALLPWLRNDGLFHNIVDNPSTFPEVNLSQMCASVLFTAFKNKWIRHEAPYSDAAERMADAAMRALRPDGFVYPVCGAPRFDAPGTAPEGQAFFLIMKASMQQLS
ncbi:MAG: glycoside hydrolase family 88 protein [Clostridia bacterium]|nr:glycoside hydrolase family 88 protein [Clostridia bacterium]